MQGFRQALKERWNSKETAKDILDQEERYKKQ